MAILLDRLSRRERRVVQMVHVVSGLHAPSLRKTQKGVPYMKARLLTYEFGSDFYKSRGVMAQGVVPGNLID